MRQAKFVILSILTLIVIVVAMQNREPVETRLLFVTVTMPRVILLASTTLIGFALGVIVAYLLRGSGRTSSGQVRRRPEET